MNAKVITLQCMVPHREYPGETNWTLWVIKRKKKDTQLGEAGEVGLIYKELGDRVRDRKLNRIKLRCMKISKNPWPRASLSAHQRSFYLQSDSDC